MDDLDTLGVLGSQKSVFIQEPPKQYVDRIHELEQELKIRTEQNEELYGKLCYLEGRFKEASEVLLKSQNMKNSDRNNYIAQYLLKWGIK